MKVHDYLDFYARKQPATELAICAGFRITYGQAVVWTNHIAHALAAAGLERGERLVLLCKNSIELLLLYHGASKAGVVPVPLNYRSTPAEWYLIASDVEPRLVISDAEFTPQVDSIRDELSSIQQCVTIGADGRPGWVNLDRWIDDSPITPLDRRIDDRDDAIQMYTSGTTGQPKGAVLTHGAITANVAQLVPVAGLSAAERFLLVTPLYHAAGVVTMFSCIAWGGTLCIHRDFQAGQVVQALREDCIAATMFVPTMIRTCLREVPGIAEDGFADLRLITYGASPIDPQMLRHAMQVFGCGFAQRYGTTETLSISWLTPADHRRALDERPELLLSAGRALPGTDVRVVDQDDRELPQGDVGEFVVRGPQLMRGYWKSPDATAEVLRDGWMHTGDAGFMDEEGYLYIRDRVKDMIVSGGENVYPREIENVLEKHPDVAEVAVIGVPDEKWGETVRPLIVLREGATATEDQLIHFCREHLAGFKLPRSIEFVARLSRSPTGKVLKHELREPFWQGYDRRVS